MRNNEITPEQHQIHFEAVKNIIFSIEDKFEQLILSSDLCFEKESMFAIQLFSSNTYLSKVGFDNPVSVASAMLNIAGVGLSLNPATKFAHLVPRQGMVVLDIPYGGLIEIATSSGSIKWAKAVEVFANDQFEFLGVNQEPIHKFDPFAKAEDRGAFIGVYCIAKTVDNEKLIGTMSADEIHKIRALSKAYNSSNGPSGPWLDFPGPMRKKTIIKREYNTWPKGKVNSHRLHTAIDVLNQHEGLTDVYLNEQNNNFSTVSKSYDPKDYEMKYDADKISDEVKRKVLQLISRAEQSNM